MQNKKLEKIKGKKPNQKKEGLKEKEEHWLSANVFIKLGIVFFVTQTIGMIVAMLLLAQGAQQTVFTENINDVANAGYLIAMILGMTAFILIVLHYRKKREILWYIEAIAIFATTVIVINSFIPTNDLIVFGGAIIILLWRYTHKESLLFRDFVGIIAIVGAGSLLGISLGLLPVVVFIIALAIYDIIAVFGTKHMLTIGKEVVKRNFAFTIALPTKKHTFELGNGDLVIPLMVASSIMANGAFANNYLVASLCLGASFIGLMTSIYLVAKKRFAMPALPPQTLLMIIVIGTAILLGL